MRKIADALETVCVDTLEAGFITKAIYRKAFDHVWPAHRDDPWREEAAHRIARVR